MERIRKIRRIRGENTCGRSIGVDVVYVWREYVGYVWREYVEYVWRESLEHVERIRRIRRENTKNT